MTAANPITRYFTVLKSLNQEYLNERCKEPGAIFLAVGKTMLYSIPIITLIGVVLIVIGVYEKAQLDYRNKYLPSRPGNDKDSITVIAGGTIILTVALLLSIGVGKICMDHGKMLNSRVVPLT